MKRQNLILIIIDCLRSDMIRQIIKEPYSSIGKLAKKGIFFSNMKATTTVTTPCFASIFTGLYPHRHRLRTLHGYSLPTESKTLAEILTNAGYYTYAFFAGPLIAETGLHKGFFEAECRTVPKANAVSPTDYLSDKWGSKLRYRLKSGGFKEPWVIILHLWELHRPHHLREKTISQYFLAARSYRKALNFLDIELSKLFELISNDDIIMVTGDHGENLPKITIPTGVTHKPIHTFLKRIHIPERYFLCGHAFHIYDWILTIPFILKANKLSDYQKSIHYQVRQIDLAPSLLEILDVQIPKDLDGASLLPFIYGKEDRDRTAYFESVHTTIDAKSWLVGLHDGKWKYFYAPENSNIDETLFNTLNDPNELHNLSALNPDICSRMRFEIMKLHGGDQPKIDGHHLDEKDRDAIDKQLKALGYM